MKLLSKTADGGIVLENWDIFDKNGQPTGKTVRRGNLRLRSGEYHMVVHIWIKGADGRWLIQRRSHNKRPMANEWAATGGSVVAGEKSLDAAKRELFEELSIDIAPEDFKFVNRIFRKHSFVDLWQVEFNGNINDLKLQKEEVACVKWVSSKELCQMIKDKLYHNYGEAYFKTVLGDEYIIPTDNGEKEENNGI